MQLDPQAFNAHLANFAEPFLYRRAFACPCINPTSGAPKHNCPQCAGKGQLWEAPVQTEAAVASSSVQLQWAKMGTWEQGDLVLSIPSDSVLYGVAQYDRVVQLTSTDRRSITMIRGDRSERLRHAVKSISRVFWLSDDQSDTVEGGIPTFNEAGELTWDSGAPPAGRSYSIAYERYVEYFCFGEFANDRAKHGGLDLPRKVVMRRFDLLGRTPPGQVRSGP